ncbi:rab-type small G protein [Thalassiosira pseudonana CCMP1335]|uniref:Rab-type small G protein n=1 Tax=Thalassiosira pseudonana TaxID=35128 RepID=B8BRY5_THAPS|nr:rab-type small G protein [Thalassiosira pseudonana CCMP1335]EED96624.1 rab-type small G protein [Thalassiosira pseudonana CCMP1335]
MASTDGVAGNEQSVKVVLLGESGVGKSSLALRFVTEKFRPYSEATIGASFIPKKQSTSFGTQQQRHIGFKIWDTAGQEKYRSLAPMYYRGASAAILVYDITNPSSFAALKDWASELKQNGPSDLVLVVCGNKLDLIEYRSVGRSVGEEYAAGIGAMYVEASAKDGKGVENMFTDVARRVPPLENLDDYLEEDVLDLAKSNTNTSSRCC